MPNFALKRLTGTRSDVLVVMVRRREAFVDARGLVIGAYGTLKDSPDPTNLGTSRSNPHSPPSRRSDDLSDVACDLEHVAVDDSRPFWGRLQCVHRCSRMVGGIEHDDAGSDPCFVVHPGPPLETGLCLRARANRRW